MNKEETLTLNRNQYTCGKVRGNFYVTKVYVLIFLYFNSSTNFLDLW